MISAVLCLGEVVWDLLPDGPVLGGAPFNTAVHLVRAGVATTLLSAVGRDEWGARALAFLRGERLPGCRIHPTLPTGTVQVALDALGVPTYTIGRDCAWTDLTGALPQAGQGEPPPSAVLVYGGVAMHALANQRLLLEQEASLRLCDLNLRPGWSDPGVARWCLEQAEVLKVNQEELELLLGWEGLAGEADLMARFGLRGLCVTLGPDGLRWRDHQGSVRTCPAASAEEAGPVIDTVGAGDAITAAIAMGLAHGAAPDHFLARGRLWAARTCAVRGALPQAGPSSPI